MGNGYEGFPWVEALNRFEKDYVSVLDCLLSRYESTTPNSQHAMSKNVAIVTVVDEVCWVDCVASSIMRWLVTIPPSASILSRTETAIFPACITMAAIEPNTIVISMMPGSVRFK